MQDAFIKSSQNFSQLVAQVQDSQWEQTVPATPEWTIKQLVCHAIDDNGIVCKTFGGSDELNADAQSDPAGAWRESAENAQTYARTVLDLDKVVHGILGEVPAGQFLNILLCDYLLHAHDLAQALSVDTSMDPELVKLAYDSMLPNAPNLHSSGNFGSAVAVPQDASLANKLLAMSGRQPD